MHRNRKEVSVGGLVILFLVLLNAVVLQQGWATNPMWYKAAYVTLPLLGIAIYISRTKRL
jgi:uncharacterized membrane protein YhdT